MRNNIKMLNLIYDLIFQLIDLAISCLKKGLQRDFEKGHKSMRPNQPLEMFRQGFLVTAGLQVRTQRKRK